MRDALQVAEGTLPHRSARGLPGLAGGFTFTIYGNSAVLANRKNRVIPRPSHDTGRRG